MIEQYFPCDRVRQRLQLRGYGELFSEFAQRLHERGYAFHTIRGYVWGVEHFVAWLNRKKLGLSDVDRQLVSSFIGNHLPNCRCPKPAVTVLTQIRPALNHLVRMLQERTETVPQSPTDRELQKFRDHLQSICGLAESTCDGRVRFMREFLQTRFADGVFQWETLKPDDVIAFVTSYAARCCPGTVQVAASSLRTFLRYLRFHGEDTATLIAAVPRVANWRLSHVPKTMTQEQLQAFLKSFDRTTATGRRDYAMGLCQAILGLRACEVAGLRLDDIDWRTGSVSIAAGKSRKDRELPLPPRVGEAIAEYLQEGRPRIDCRHVFLRHRAPRGAVSLAVVHGAMRMAFARTKGCEHLKGTHVLRHTAATNLLERGTALKEISDVLGHRCLETTTIYTKVDRTHLQSVAMPWPEVQS